MGTCGQALAQGTRGGKRGREGVGVGAEKEKDLGPRPTHTRTTHALTLVISASLPAKPVRFSQVDWEKKEKNGRKKREGNKGKMGEKRKRKQEKRERKREMKNEPSRLQSLVSLQPKQGMSLIPLLRRKKLLLV